MKQKKTLFETIKPYFDNLKKLTVDADKIFLDPAGEEVLLTILQAENELALVKEQVKIRLADAALKINPAFTSIQADKVKVYYREYGSKYYVDETQIDLVPEGLVTPKTTYSIDSKAVEKWVDEHNGMPTGIKEIERNKTLSFSLKTNGKNETDNS